MQIGWTLSDTDCTELSSLQYTIHRSWICVVSQYLFNTDTQLYTCDHDLSLSLNVEKEENITDEFKTSYYNSKIQKQWQCSTIANVKRKYRTDTPDVMIANIYTLSHTNMERGYHSVSLKSMRVVSDELRKNSVSSNWSQIQTDSEIIFFRRNK